MKEQNELERIQERIVRRRTDQSHGISIWQAVGGIALIGLAAIVIVTLPDIKRYIKISSM